MLEVVVLDCVRFSAFCVLVLVVLAIVAVSIGLTDAATARAGSE